MQNENEGNAPTYLKWLTQFLEIAGFLYFVPPNFSEFSRLSVISIALITTRRQMLVNLFKLCDRLFVV